MRQIDKIRRMNDKELNENLPEILKHLNNFEEYIYSEIPKNKVEQIGFIKCENITNKNKDKVDFLKEEGFVVEQEK